MMHNILYEEVSIGALVNEIVYSSFQDTVNGLIFVGYQFSWRSNPQILVPSNK